VKAVVLNDQRVLETRDVDEPSPGPAQVRIRVEACGICGSDLHMRPSEAIPLGTIFGHEFSGLVDAVGEGVDGWGDGDRVCVYPFRPLDHHDLESAMTTGIGLGQIPGAYAEAIVVDAVNLWRLPEDMDLEHGALVEPLAVALHGLNVGEVTSEDTCAVIGAGPIGVMSCIALRARGVEKVVVVEKNPRRQERIRQLGFQAVGIESVHEDVIGALSGVPSVVLECAGNPAAPNLAVELVAPSGRIVLLGVLEEPVEINQLLLMLKEAQMRASFCYRPGDFDEAIELLRSGRAPAADLITGREPLDRAEEMFAELLSPGTEHIKVLLTPGGAGAAPRS
jgi:(R,R)-butanediol dehydrogenase/meso-butanediol dehydrogenase/diacetyl reductase